MQRKEFEKLVKEIRPLLLSTAVGLLGSPEEGADAVQDALLRLWSFRSRLDDYDNPAAVATLILRRLCLSSIRSRRPSVEIEQAMRLIAIDEENEPADPILLGAIESLPKMEQTVLRMKHIEGMETEEIASLVGSNSIAVRTALSRARKKVRDIYLKAQA